MKMVTNSITVLLTLCFSSISFGASTLDEIFARLGPIYNLSSDEINIATELRPFLKDIEKHPISTQVHYLILLMHSEHLEGNIATALDLNQRVEALNNKAPINTEHNAYNLLSKGILNTRSGNYDIAISALNEAIAFAEMHDHYNIGFDALQNAGDVMAIQDNYIAAMGYFRRARNLQINKLLVDIDNEEHLKRESSISYRNALAYGQMGRYKESAEYFQETLKLDRQLGHRRNIGFSLYQLGRQYYLLKDHQKSIRYLNTLLEFLKATDYSDKHHGFGAQTYLTQNYLDLGDIESAKFSFEQATAVLPDIENLLLKSRYFLAKAKWDLQQKNYQKVIDTLTQPDHNFNFSKLSELGYQSLHLISQAQSELGLHSEALSTHRAMHKLFLERNNTLAMISAEIERANFDFKHEKSKNSVLKYETEAVKANLKNTTQEAINTRYQLVLAIIFIASLFIIILVLYRHRKKLKKLSEIDPLTDIFNRRHILEYGQLLLQTSPSNTAVLLLDIDHFKSINDKYGHSYGDTVLKLFAKTAEQVSSNKGKAGRIGGEEFLMVFQDTNIIEAQGIARRFALALTKLQLNQPINITASIGISISSTASADFSQLMDAADKAMYRAKRNGRNRVESHEILSAV